MMHRETQRGRKSPKDRGKGGGTQSQAKEPMEAPQLEKAGRVLPWSPQRAC